MKILIFTMYFAPEPVGIAPMATDLAEFLADRGWDVSVVAGIPKLPAWKPRAGYFGKWSAREGNIRRAWVYIPAKSKTGNMPVWRRILHDSSIALSGLPVALRSGRPDLILSITPPLQLAAAAIALKRWWGCPLVNWIQDIVPDAAINLGMMREGKGTWVARKFERFIYNHADKLAVISSGMQTNLGKKGVPESKIALATNWADTKPFEAPNERERVRKQMRVGSGDFMLVYGGSFAAKQVLENVVDAMKLLEAHRDIHVFLAGDGIRKNAIQEEITRLDVPRISFIDLLNPQEYAQLLRAADLLILNQSRSLIDALLPSKLLTYWLAGKPVIAAVNDQSEAAKLVRASGGGEVVEPENPQRFAESVLVMKSQPLKLQKMGESGLCYVQEHYVKERVLSRFETLLASQYHS